jgi:TPR repeat protein
MSEQDLRDALVPVQSASIALKGSQSLAKRGLGDLRLLEAAEEWFQKAKDLYNAVPKEYSVAQFRSALGEFFKCLQRASNFDPNHPGIQSWLGAAYRDGLGTDKDMVAAANWFRRAADQGVADAQYELAGMYMYGDEGIPQDSSEAVLLYQKASEQGHVDAQLVLGAAYLDGAGLTRDIVGSTFWFRRAAEQGSGLGQYFLAEALEEGRGVEKDSIEAASWYRKAAEQGIASAQYGLGLMYKKGDGVEKDLGEAVRWFLKASAQEYSPAHFQLGHMHHYGSGLPKDYTKAAQYLHKAAEPNEGRGDIDHLSTAMLAQLELADMYRVGRGVEKSATLSESWFRKHQVAQRELSKLRQVNSDVSERNRS